MGGRREAGGQTLAVSDGLACFPPLDVSKRKKSTPRPLTPALDSRERSARFAVRRAKLSLSSLLSVFRLLLYLSLTMDRRGGGRSGRQRGRNFKLWKTARSRAASFSESDRAAVPWHRSSGAGRTRVLSRAALDGESSTPKRGVLVLQVSPPPQGGWGPPPSQQWRGRGGRVNPSRPHARAVGRRM